MIGHLQDRLDSESGLFRDPQHRDQYTHLTLSRVTAVELGTINDLSGGPLYPSLLDNTENSDEAA